MERNRNIFSSKYTKRWLLGSGAIAVGIAVAAVVAAKVESPFKPAFFNYKSYIDDVNRDLINKDFDYKEFNEIQDFTIALNNHKAVAGIGSDFQAIGLIKKGLIKPIDFNQLLEISDPNQMIKTENQLKKKLQEIYTPIVFNHLASYDEELKDIDRPQKHLWQYFVPYYIQDAVFAYAKHKQSGKPTNQTFGKLLTDEDFQKNRDELLQQAKDPKNTSKFVDPQKEDTHLYSEYLKPNSLFNLINTAFKNGYQDMVLTDAVRAELLYGSSYYFPKKATKLTPHSGKVDLDNYERIVNSFVEMVNKSTGQNITDTSNTLSFNGDGQAIVQALLNTRNGNVNSAIMYNGDALDTYYAADNGFTFNKYKDGKLVEKNVTVDDGTVEAIKFRENILLVDGLVVSETISKPTEKTLYHNLSHAFYAHLNNINTNKNIIDMYDEYLTSEMRDVFLAAAEELEKNNKEYKFSSDPTTIFNNFKNELIEVYKKTLEHDQLDDADLQNFRDLAAKKFNDPLFKEFFEQFYFNIKQKDDENYKKSQVKEETEDVLNTMGYWFSHMIIDEDAAPKFFEVLSEKYPNVTNFNLINYTPSTQLDYKLIRRNYFVSDDNTYDVKAVKIYEVDESDKNIIHARLWGIDDKVNSLLNTYYYSRTKR
ncbi:hypothetical protein ACXYRK_03630 [Mycoplasma sp. AC1221]